MMRFCLLFCCWLCSNVVFSQSASVYFKPIPASAIALPEKAERKLIPLRYDTYRLDYAGIKASLDTAPWEFTDAARQHPCVVALPTASGAIEEFAVWQTAVLEPALAAEAPYIHTFTGRSLRDARKTVHLSYTTRGFRAMMSGGDFSIEYVEPYAWGQTEYYMAYAAKDMAPADLNMAPGDFHLDPALLEHEPGRFVPKVEPRGTQLDPITFRTLKLVVSATGEFSQDNGGNKPDVLSAITEYVNMVNVGYERDFALRFQVVQATLLVIFLDPGTDPFSGADPGTLASQNQEALNGANVTPNAYDVGHVFARGGGGVGGLGVVCQAGKFLGCTAGSGSYGHSFIYVASQELGHQLGGNHSWNRCGGFAEDQRHGPTAFEPGSGSTIMSYVGGCGSDNVQGSADLYFHAGSIEEIQNNILYNPAAQCGSKVQTDNIPPTVKLNYPDNFFIPIGTPFELNGSATDPNPDSLTYCWEEMDLGPEVPLDTQVASSPIFRTFPAVNATNRYFPKIATVVNNSSDIREQLPIYTRDLTFRLTARDNHPGGGGVGWADVAFKSWGGAGPFVVMAPNTGTEIWHVGEYAEVRWDVANTDKPPVNCTYVNIRLSLDGGYTYPITLASHVGNDGSHYVLVPNQLSSLARVRVDGENNVFFDISNKNFRIQQPTQPSLTLSVDNDLGVLCLPASQVVEVHTAGVLGFSDPVQLEVVGALPANVTASWSATTIQPGESATLTLDFSNVEVEDVFTIALRATASGIAPIERNVVLTTLRNDFSTLALDLPPNGATELQLNQTLHWTKALDALTYDVQFASDPSFAPGTILVSNTSTTLDSFKIPVFLAKGTPYFWRVRPKNECGVHDWTEPFFFSTFAEKCTEWAALDLPKNLTSNGKPSIESKVIVNQGGPIKSMEVRQIKGYHEFFKDLDVHLTSPEGTEITLWSARCGNFNGFFNFRLNDEAPGAFPCPPPNNSTAYKAQTPLSAFTGQNSTGTWTLRVNDTQYGGGGTFEAFSLEFCSEIALSPPYLVNNNPMFVDPGTNRAITPDLLLVEDATNTHSQLQYTLVTVPQQGHLELNWTGAMEPGDHFTQADLDNGALRYFDYGGHTPDGFRFMVTDGEGGFFGTPKFLIQNFMLGAGEPAAPAFDFRLFPNPANDAVWIALDEPATDGLRVALFNMAGQLMSETRLPAGTDRLQVPTATLPRGLYLVQVQGAVRKLVLR